MIDPFLGMIIPILELEGGYVNDPDDSGGATNWGVTEAVARSAGYVGEMRDMTQDHAIAIYRLRYWQEPQFDKLYSTFPPMADYLLNIGINVGHQTASMFLQRGLNVLNEGGLFEPLKVDGVCGPVTRSALVAYRVARGDGDGFAILLGVVRSLAVCHYVELAESTLRNKKFEYGWLRRALLT